MPSNTFAGTYLAFIIYWTTMVIFSIEWKSFDSNHHYWSYPPKWTERYFTGRYNWSDSFSFPLLFQTQFQCSFAFERWQCAKVQFATYSPLSIITLDASLEHEGLQLNSFRFDWSSAAIINLFSFFLCLLLWLKFVSVINSCNNTL